MNRRTQLKRQLSKKKKVHAMKFNGFLLLFSYLVEVLDFIFQSSDY